MLQLPLEDITSSESAAATPRLPPTVNGNSDLHDLDPEDFGSLDAQSTIHPSHLSASLHTNPSHAPAVPVSARDPLITSFSEINIRNVPQAGLHGINRASNMERVAPQHKAGTDSLDTRHALPPQIARTKSLGAISNMHKSRAGLDRYEITDVEASMREISSTQEEAKASGDQRKRSSSRSAKVEKRIEATLAKAEPASNDRSRKSSHLLGLFKENTVQEPKKPRSPSSNLSGNASSKSPSALVKDEKKFWSGVELFDDNRLPSSIEGQQPLEDRDRSPTQSSKSTADLESRSVKSRHGTEDMWPAMQKQDEETSATATRQTLPRSLLREIREHHELNIPNGSVTPPQRKTFSATLPDEKDQVTPTQKNARTLSAHLEDPSRIAEPFPAIDEEDEELDDESDKEQISSALYYPHKTPSLDAFASGRVNSGTVLESFGRSKLGVHSGEHSVQDLDQESPSEEVDIAIQSQNKHKYLHGDLPKTIASVEEPKASSSAASSASESDYESYDESGRSVRGDDTNLTDDVENTPRASPTTRTKFLRSKVRKEPTGPAVPKNAVELQPYDHQVGGHSTVFQFSKRAVCKPLSNRENEFYEVIERQNPELLKFLPRYEAPF